MLFALRRGRPTFTLSSDHLERALHRQEAPAAERSTLPLPHQVDDGRHDVERAADAVIADGEAVGTDIGHPKEAGMTTGSSIGHWPDAPEGPMFKAHWCAFP